MSRPARDALEVLKSPVESLPPVISLPTARRKSGFDASADITPPGSKSLTNRALLLAALASGESVLRGALLEADDAKVMLRAIGQLGAVVREDGGPLRITGVGGSWQTPPEGLRLDLSNAGTAVRFLAASALCSPAPLTIDGNARMRQRPIGELVEVLVSLGCSVEYLGSAGCPPIRITPPQTVAATHSLEVGTTQSSQFISGLLLIGAWMGGLTVRFRGTITSGSYISMTVGLLAHLGVPVQSSVDGRVLRVGADPPSAFVLDIEPDASGATYWWGAGAILPGANIRVLGLGERSLQGDSKFPELLGRMGARVVRELAPAAVQVVGAARLSPILADMAEMPDAAMTLAAVACFAQGTSILRGLRTLRVKESDRIEAMRIELTKIGVRVETPVASDPDALTVTPPSGGVDGDPNPRVVEFDTYDDHRMAMSLSLIGLRRANVRIRNPACVAKTYPGFWRDYARLCE